MSLFEISNKNKLQEISRNDFKLEKELQSLTEVNLKIIFNLEFISSEFTVGKFRLDSLAFDKTTNSFVIIEYKKNKNFSVIDQGYAYLSLMLNNKADFILEYNEQTSNLLKKVNIDWSQSRIIFISQDITTYQKEAINFKDLPIELWEIKRYKNKIVSYTKISNKDASKSIKTISKKDKNIYRVSDEIKKLYETLKSLILNLGNIEYKATKLYIAFISSRNVVDVNVKKKSMKLWLNLKYGELDDPKNLMRDVSKIGHWGNGQYECNVTKDTDLDYLLSLIKQSYVKNSN